VSEQRRNRSVRGSFFAEYVRMIRRRKDVDFGCVLRPEDLPYLSEIIRPDAWYPMETFERLGEAILEKVPGATLDAVRLWGRFSAGEYYAKHPQLVAANDPMESLMRLKVIRSTLFDFPAFDIPMLTVGHALVSVRYHMGHRAEEAACFQTMGFCEAVVSEAGAADVKADFRERAWAGDDGTVIELEWSSGPASRRH
jgi:hypothetical protein